jgi:uracil-DNA glycosylase family 4
MPIKTRSDGPAPARIMIVGEAPGVEEERQGRPFVGGSGTELTNMLHEAGIIRAECFLTNVCKYRPPGNEIERFFLDSKCTQPGAEIQEGLHDLRREIELVQPNVIIACGNVPLWALRGHRGITDWRGSSLTTKSVHRSGELSRSFTVLPTIHPAAVLREWSWRQVVVHDLRKAGRLSVSPTFARPEYSFTIRPSFQVCMQTLDTLLRQGVSASTPRRLAVDIETRQGHIACIGIAWSRRDAICIPLMCVERPEGYWPAEEEAAIVLKLQELLAHTDCRVVGQNFLYDAQYFAKHYGFVPRLIDDTMFQQHVLYAGAPKGLDYLSSMYCEYHEYWKSEGKTWDPKVPEEQLWVYNCKDAVITYEVAETLDSALDKMQLREQYTFQMELWWHTLHMMLRGIAVNKEAKNKLGGELLEAIMERDNEITAILGHPLNPRSPKQMQALFYHDLGMPVQYNRKTRRPSLDEEALQAIARKEPLLRDLIRRIVEVRSIGVIRSTFVEAREDSDGRMRSSFNPAGTETFRFSSSTDAFGSGANLENIPRGLEDEEIETTELAQFATPNIRKLYIPDSGYTIAECDLEGADAQVVAEEADDEIMREIFRKRLKLHVENGKMFYGASMMGPDGKREPYYTRIKIGAHSTNYGITARSLAQAINVPVHEAEKFQRRWFEIHPGILDWHRRIDSQLQTTRTVYNRFGYRRKYFDRIDGLLGEALAWVPQSSVACVTNRALCRLRPAFTEYYNLYPLEQQRDRFTFEAVRRLFELGVQLLLQVHDSFVFQYPTYREAAVLPLLRSVLSVTIPYDKPLIIPWGLKTSTRSWGDAEERDWPEPEVKAA